MTLQRAAFWMFWLIGTVMLAVVVNVAARLAENGEFEQLAANIEPHWLLLAVALQAATYGVGGWIWRYLGRNGGYALGVGDAVRLSLAELFVDQALPSAGLSGTLLVARVLMQRGVERALVTAGVVVRAVSYYNAYVVALMAAVALTIVHHQSNRVLILAALGFAAFAATFSACALLLVGPSHARWRRRLASHRLLSRVLALAADADPRIARDPRLLAVASLLQLLVILLDVATMAVLIRALGVSTPVTGVFTSFMLASLFRSLGILPGGLGSFEAVSVWTLGMTGLPVSVALSATLAFRILSFWLPMLPGFWYSRHALARDVKDVRDGQS